MIRLYSCAQPFVQLIPTAEEKRGEPYDPESVAVVVNRAILKMAVFESEIASPDGQAAIDKNAIGECVSIEVEGIILIDPALDHGRCGYHLSLWLHLLKDKGKIAQVIVGHRFEPYGAASLRQCADDREVPCRCMLQSLMHWNHLPKMYSFAGISADGPSGADIALRRNSEFAR